jgi:hypothetical protein
MKKKKSWEEAVWRVRIYGRHGIIRSYSIKDRSEVRAHKSAQSYIKHKYPSCTTWTMTKE